MAKPGRNDPCPCGSGKKYKKCCLMKDEAEDQARLRHDARTQAKPAMDFSMADDTDFDDDLLMDASNAVVDLVHAGKLDEAEAGARELLAKYPDVHDGWDRLGLVHEARGENRQAAHCYRKVIEFLQQNPGYSDTGFEEILAERITKLDPPTGS
jgi:tetratricopeptide (TPR) repeat protein